MTASKILLVPGQGSIKKNQIVSAINTDIGKKLSSIYVQEIPEFKDMLDYYIDNTSVNPQNIDVNLYSMWSSFFYCDWFVKTRCINLYDINKIITYSAGIIFAAYYTQQISLNKALKFMQKRAKLLSRCPGYEMYAYVTNNAKHLFEVAKREEIQIYPSIKWDKNKGVLVAKRINLEKNIKKLNLILKVKPLGIKIPYHSLVLNKYIKEYTKIVDELEIHENTYGELIFFSKTASLHEEIIYELNNVFDWDDILTNLTKFNNFSFIDMSPNKFMIRSLTKRMRRINNV